MRVGRLLKGDFTSSVVTYCFEVEKMGEVDDEGKQKYTEDGDVCTLDGAVSPSLLIKTFNV